MQMVVNKVVLFWIHLYIMWTHFQYVGRRTIWSANSNQFKMIYKKNFKNYLSRTGIYLILTQMHYYFKEPSWQLQHKGYGLSLNIHVYYDTTKKYPKVDLRELQIITHNTFNQCYFYSLLFYNCGNISWPFLTKVDK